MRMTSVAMANEKLSQVQNFAHFQAHVFCIMFMVFHCVNTRNTVDQKYNNYSELLSFDTSIC